MIELLKSVHICQIIIKIKLGRFFMDNAQCRTVKAKGQDKCRTGEGL